MWDANLHWPYDLIRVSCLYKPLSTLYVYTLLFKAGYDTYARCEHSYSYNTHQVAYLDFHTCVCVCVCVQQFCTFQVMLYGVGTLISMAIHVSQGLHF